MTFEELTKQIEKIDEERDDIRAQISFIKKQITDLETDLIGLNIKKDALKEQIKRMNYNR